MRVRRSRVVAAAADDVWRLVADPYSLPRWWPRTQRVEGVHGGGWTTVLGNERSGRSVRADWRLDSSRRPVRRWSQELEETPFARLFTRNVVELEAAPEGGATRVTLTIEQQVRGWARLAPFMIRGAAKRQAAEALDGIERAVGE
jgi:carbon monoxide dehydrogenase subunit G